MRASDFDYDLPEELIAQHALNVRDQSRLLLLNRGNSTVAHKLFQDLDDYLRDDDVLVLNNSKVIRARLRGVNRRSGGRFELLLVEEVSTNNWWAMTKPGKRARVGTQITLLDHTGSETAFVARVMEINPEGHRRLQFEGRKNIVADLDRIGEVPLPPYIHRSADPSDTERYQTVFAHTPGSVAAPTAGLHFTQAMLNRLRQRGIKTVEVTLHVGLGTFAPVKAEHLEEHVMHEERYAISEGVAETINTAKRNAHRIVAVGTTSLRALESAARPDDATVEPGTHRTRLFAYPPHEFRIVDALLTNFHLPRSTLLMLVSAFAAPGQTRGRDLMLNTYAEAVRERYRFFSYGDAMLIV